MITAESDIEIVQDLLKDQASEIERLKSELSNRDVLVEAITGRLEETVEQLDRLQRQGNSRPASNAAGSSSRELVEAQQQLSERVEQSLSYWESTAGYFDQILQRLDEIADARGTGDLLSKAHSPNQEEPEMSAYERMKANLLSQSPGPTSATSHAPTSPLLSLAPSSPVPDTSDLSPELAAALPTPIDLETATPAELAAAVEVRDTYITHLIQSFRTRDDAIFNHVDWNLLKSAPEDLRPELMALSQRLKEKVQQEELGISMERARLAREHARIELVKQQLESQIRRLAPGAPLPESTKSTKSEKVEKPAKDGWLKRLKR